MDGMEGRSMNLVPCSCGANLAEAPPEAVWMEAGVATEVRTCLVCEATRHYRLVDILGSPTVRLEDEPKRWWDSLGAAWEELVGTDERPTEPVGTVLVGARYTPVAVVVRAGCWRVLSPEDLAP